MKIHKEFIIYHFFTCLILIISKTNAYDRLPCSNKNKKQLKGAATNYTEKGFSYWPNGVVYFSFSSEYTSAQKAIIKKGMEMIENKTRINGKDCIKFKERTTESSYIDIISDQGCYSYIGMKKDGNQILSLQIGSPSTRSCLFPDIAAHELIHALGFDHEQARQDRDRYVNVNFSNIIDGAAFNFEINTNYVNLNTPYEIKSIMHYRSRAGAKPNSGNPYVITSKIPPPEIPLPTEITDIDANEIRLLYKCGISNKIDWKETKTFSSATSCNFVTTDLKTVYIAKSKCPNECLTNIGCTHFVWVDDKLGGVCYLKSGNVAKPNANYINDDKMTCGIIKPKDKGRSLTSNEQLNPYEALISSNGIFRTFLTFDGKFVIEKQDRIIFTIDLTTEIHSKALKSPYKLTLKSSGNLVITDNTDTIVWQTNTKLKHPKLIMQNNGNLELLNSYSYNVFWSSSTTEQVIKIKNKRTTFCIFLKNGEQLFSVDCKYKHHDRGYLNWGLTKKQDGYYLITNRVTGHYLHDDSTSGLGLSQDIKNQYQDWKYVDDSFINRGTGKALSSDSTFNIISTTPDSKSNFQKWNLLY